MEATILLQPTSTPLTDIKFIQRLPCGEVERIRKVVCFSPVSPLSRDGSFVGILGDKAINLLINKQETFSACFFIYLNKQNKLLFQINFELIE